MLLQDTMYLIQRPCYQRGSSAKIQQAIRLHEDKETHSAVYGHVSRSSDLTKIILQDTVKEGRRQGGQKKSREDDIREWTGLELAKSQRTVKSGEKWKEVVEGRGVICGAPNDPRG